MVTTRNHPPGNVKRDGTRTAMNTLHHLQSKIIEGLNDLFEAFYLLQEKIEESEVDGARLRSTSFVSAGTTLTGCERNTS